MHSTTNSMLCESLNMLSLIPLLVPGPVTSLTAVFGSTSGNFDTTTQAYNINLTISFSPPTFLNGILDNYNVSVEGKYTDPKTSKLIVTVSK